MTAPGRAGRERGPDLPVFLSRFVGRAHELAHLAEQLDLHRVVTLIAPGGVGKTRLAVRVAEQTAGRWRGGVWFADYSSATDVGVVTMELATVLGVNREPGQMLLDRLLDSLPRSRCLLVLDGCEHLQPAIRDVTVALLRGSPSLHILATSRERLDIPGEALFPVVPLPCPPLEGPLTADALRSYEAVALFEDRAMASQPDFEIGDENAEVTARLCVQLDGIPLALELAAARLRMMSLLDLESHLSDRFRLLTGGPSERHESVRTTIDWSYRFLDEEERSMFRRLSVFSSGARLDAAAAVLEGRGMDLVDALGRLVDKSLLEATTDVDGRTRYQMLRTIRQYALELLTESGELDDAMARSAEHHLGVAERAAAMAESSEWRAWLDRLEAEHDNLLAVLAWARERKHPALPTLVIALGWFWQRRGDPSEGRRWLELAQTAVTDDHDRLAILRWATSLAAHENDVAAATSCAEQALELANRLGDPLQSAHARLALGNLIFYTQQAADWEQRATSNYEAALDFYDRAGLAFRSIAVMLNLSLLALARGDTASGRGYAVRVEERAREGGWTHWQTRVGIRLGIAAFLDGDDEDAELRLAACVRSDADDPVANSPLQGMLRWLATVAARRGELERSARLFGGASRVEARTPVQTFMPRELNAVVLEWQTRVREELGEAAYEEHVEAGRKLRLEEVRRLALRDSEAEGGRNTALSQRELEVIDLVAEGLTNREVSARLHLSTRTVDAHLDHIRNKLGLRTRAQIVRWLTETRQRSVPADHEGLLLG